MPEEPEPVNPGLQLERTTLAWLRTTLAFTAVLLVLLRLVLHVSTAAAVACAALTLPLAASVTGLAWRRHIRGWRSLRSSAPLPGGGLPAAVTALAVGVGCTGLLYVLLH